MKTKNKIIGIAVIAVTVVVLALVYLLLSDKKADPENKSDGKKQIVIEVISISKERAEYKLSTDAEYLSHAMEEAEGLTYNGTYGPYGIMLESVNGETAVYEEDGAYWSILVDGEYGIHGIDTQPVVDGVTYSLVYTLA